MTQSKLGELLIKYTDDIRHPVIRENPVWEEELAPALGELLMISATARPEEMETKYNLFKVFLEIVYVKGIEYGRTENK